jgi:hypothetical protein
VIIVYQAHRDLVFASWCFNIMPELTRSANYGDVSHLIVVAILHFLPYVLAIFRLFYKYRLFDFIRVFYEY